MLESHTALHCPLHTLPLVLVCFGVAAEALGVPVAAVVPVAAPADQHGRQCFDSGRANAGSRQPWVDSCSPAVEIAPQLF